MFLLRTFNYVKGYITIRAEGFFVERMINLCQIRNIKIWDLQFKYSGIIEFKINAIDYNKLQEIAQITRSNIEIVNRKGVINLAKRYKGRKVFLVACIAISAIIYLINIRIWNIEVVGNKNVTLEEVYSELEKENFKIGTLKGDVDFAKIKNAIYQRRDDIVWMGISIKGTKATVEIVERINPIENKFKNKPCNIVADKDGVIESIYVKEGLANVQKGDVVFKGDLLVNGIVSSEHAEDRYVSSNAEITIKTWYTGKIAIPYQKTILMKSGNRHNTYKLNLRKLYYKFIKYWYKI